MKHIKEVIHRRAKGYLYLCLVGEEDEQWFLREIKSIGVRLRERIVFITNQEGSISKYKIYDDRDMEAILKVGHELERIRSAAIGDWKAEFKEWGIA